MPVAIVNLNVIQVLGLSCFGLLIGGWLKRLLPALDRLNIPTSIVGGLVYAVAILLLRDRWLNLEMDMALRNLLMVAFFTTIGMSASLKLVWQGGKLVVVFFTAAVVGLILQNALGVGMAKALGIDPLIGLLAGSVSLTGGPATALAFGQEFEKLGLASATVLGLAAAVAGILSGGLLGGFVGGSLIRRRGLRGTGEAAAGDAGAAPEAAQDDGSPLASVIALAIAMGLGTLVSAWLAKWMILPAYIGAMIVAGFIRNLDDHYRFAGISPRHMEVIGDIALDIFIVMALLTLRLWELVQLALPVLLILGLQIALMVVLCRLLIFPLMGRDYQAAVMTTGYCGFMLGTTANAMGCMNELVRRYGPTPRAFLVVSIVGAFLIDFMNAFIINVFMNLLR